MADSRSSAFWKDLAAEHADDLERYGLDRVKRRQAFRYFNWNWHWNAIRNSEQLRFLLRNSTVPSLVRAVVAPATLSDPAWEGAPLGRADRWLYTVCIRLLWDYARRFGDQEALALEEPLLGSPIPLQWRGRLISQDLANSALEIAAIRRGLDGRRPRNIVEIGAGYGRTAYALLRLFPDAAYTIVDIEPALTISRWYLTTLFPTARLRFAAAADRDTLSAGATPFDLAVSISSLQEMLPSEIARYLKRFDETVQGMLYLKQWREWSNPRDNVVLRFDEYPIPRHWSLLFREPCPVQTQFVQAAWRVDSAFAP